MSHRRRFVALSTWRAGPAALRNLAQSRHKNHIVRRAADNADNNSVETLMSASCPSRHRLPMRLGGCFRTKAEVERQGKPLSRSRLTHNVTWPSQIDALRKFVQPDGWRREIGG